MQEFPYKIDIWHAADTVLDSLAAPRACVEWLSEDERRRWQRFARPADRARFLLARVMTRSVLAQQLQQLPQDLAFVQDHHGKPHLQPPALHFNLSHTDGLVVLAVSPAVKVGVDVEHAQRAVAAMALAQRYFSTPEVRALEALEGEAQRELFFALWTLKEAWVKAKGVGLRLPLDAFSFDLPVQGGISLQCDAQLDETAEAWGFWRHALGAHRMALAYPLIGNAAPTITVHEWQARDIPG